MLQNLGWEDLKSREQSKTIAIYQIDNSLVDIPAEKYFIHAGTSTKAHENRSLVPCYSFVACNSSFFSSTNCHCNTHPVSIVKAPSFDVLWAVWVLDIKVLNLDIMFLSCFKPVYSAFLHRCTYSTSVQLCSRLGPAFLKTEEKRSYQDIVRNCKMLTVSDICEYIIL